MVARFGGGTVFVVVVHFGAACVAFAVAGVKVVGRREDDERCWVKASMLSLVEEPAEWVARVVDRAGDGLVVPAEERGRERVGQVVQRPFQRVCARSEQLTRVRTDVFGVSHRAIQTAVAGSGMQCGVR